MLSSDFLLDNPSTADYCSAHPFLVGDLQGNSMTDVSESAITTQVLIQIRDEMRAMRASFEARFDGLEARMSRLENRMESLEARMDALEARIDAIEKRMDSLERRTTAAEKRGDDVDLTLKQLERTINDLVGESNALVGRIDSLEMRTDAIDEKNEARYQALLRRFNAIDADLKKFASVTNDAILHYAGEMDTVRDRLNIIETKFGIPYPSE